MIVSIWLALVARRGRPRLKAWRPRAAAAALATYGDRGAARAARRAVAARRRASSALAVGARGGRRLGARGGGGAVRAVRRGHAAALLAGRGGRPCACFGSASRLGWTSPAARGARSALLAGVAALGWLPSAPSGYDRWLTLGLSLSARRRSRRSPSRVLALAREVGVLRLSAGARAARWRSSREGPAAGRRAGVGGRRSRPVRARRCAWPCSAPRAARCARRWRRRSSTSPPIRCWPCASSTSSATRPCGRRRPCPAARTRSRSTLDGVALAKGTFNGLGQLESVLATARLRERGLSLAA